MQITVQKLAEISGVSVRTLHYYDEIGLLKPGKKGANGYRYYDEPQMIKLQQILFYRELNLTLHQIKQILDDPGFNIIGALNDHKSHLSNEMRRLKGLMKTIDKTIQKLQGKRTMSNKEYFENLTKEEIERHKSEAREVYGDFVDKTKGWSTEKLKKTLAEGQKISESIAELMDRGSTPSSPEVQSLIEEHYRFINKFWDCSHEAYVNLGKMYVEDERFTKNIDMTRTGLAQFMQQAMEYFAS